MLGIGMQEIIIILVVALIVIGPKKLPDLAKALGRALGEFRRAADDLKENLDINGVREEKEKLMREFSKEKLSKDFKVKEDKGPAKTKEPVKTEESAKAEEPKEEKKE
jgi:TatA/E family protein of Tat protein translocase